MADSKGPWQAKSRCTSDKRNASFLRGGLGGYRISVAPAASQCSICVKCASMESIFRYISTRLAPYIGKPLTLPFQPQDIAEIRGQLLCRAVCAELAGATVPLREILRARNHRPHYPRGTVISPFSFTSLCPNRTNHLRNQSSAGMLPCDCAPRPNRRSASPRDRIPSAQFACPHLRWCRSPSTRSRPRTPPAHNL